MKQLLFYFGHTYRVSPLLCFPYSIASVGQLQIQAMQWVQLFPHTGLPFSRWILMFLVAICGGIMGQFADRNIINSQRVAVLAGVILALLVLLKEALIEKMPALKYVLCILPPVSDLAKEFNQMEVFNLSQSIGYFLWIVIYICALYFLYMKIVLSKKMD